eukprot:SM000076S21794  [mRNA]  locus=s76:246034:248385:- [translate_table: standard]
MLLRQVVTQDGFILNMQRIRSNNFTSSAVRPPPQPAHNARPSPQMKQPSMSGAARTRRANVTTRAPPQRSTSNTASRPRRANATTHAATPAPTRSRSVSPKLPVFLDHPVFIGGNWWFGSRNSSLNVGMAKPLPLFLADHGYEVWIGHHRGSEWSPDSTRYSRDDRRFWDWSFDELALDDTPAQIRLIAGVSGHRVHFVGYNQGAVVGIIAASRLQAVQECLASLTMIGPIAYLVDVTSTVLRNWGTSFTPDRTVANIVNNFGISMTNGASPEQFLSNVTEINQSRFQMWDWASAQLNQQNYGSALPPQYDPGLVPEVLPKLIISGGNDWFADSHNVEYLAEALSGTPERIVIPEYAHLDLIYSRRVEDDVNQPLRKFLDRHNN